ncbi:MAG: hypothetical protein E6H68_13000 [Betaproteobacteria bacterium]|nr:MAG: hypothetical protein E6H68_13000 [Betaproteobacteria bacterium]
MQRSLIIGCTLFGLVLGACAGFWTGMREGWNLALMENSFSIGAGALPRLAAVRSGRASELNRAFEFDVDSGLVWSHHFLDSSLAGFLAPVWGIGTSAQDPQAIMRLANYRKTYPSLTKADVFDDVIPKTATRREDDRGSTGIEERLAIISDMVKRYATSP